MNTRPTSTPIIYYRFRLGQFYITPRLAEVVEYDDLQLALKRHANCDWGDCDPEDCEQNDHAVAEGGRIVSVYHDRNGTKFWIITEADRSVTTILLPDEY